MGFTLEGHALPTPQSDAMNLGFWDAARAGRFVMAKCSDCGNLMAAPVSNCRICLGTDISWVQASGRGTVFTFIEYYRSWIPEFEGSLPYVVAVVTLEEGPRMVLGMVTGANGEDTSDTGVVQVGDPIEIVYQERADGFRVPMAEVRRA